MENVSKALLIAGGILVTILVLSVGIYLYTIFSNQSKEYNAVISETELQKFNSKFDVYVGRTDITAQEIVSVVNLSKEYGNTVKIYVDNKEITEESEKYIKKNIDVSFSCNEKGKEIEYDETGKVNKLRFKQNKNTN